MTYIVKANNVVKRYNEHQALRGVDLHVREGSCFGLLGPNGAGKSTMMKLLTGIFSSDEGRIELFGKDIRKENASVIRKVGYVPQDITLYEKLSGWQNLSFFGQMYGIRGEKLKVKMKQVLQQVGLLDRANDAVGSYSGGMKRRINIAAALLHEPKLVILDEPTVGIDPQSRNHIFAMIRGLQADGVTVIYSTHYMEEVEALCDEVAIIDHGAIVSQGSLQQLLELHAIKAVYVEVEGMTSPPTIEGISKVRQEGAGWVLECDQPLEVMEKLAKYFVSVKSSVRALELMKPSLDSVFMKLTGTKLRD